MKQCGMLALPYLQNLCGSSHDKYEIGNPRGFLWR